MARRAVSVGVVLAAGGAMLLLAGPGVARAQEDPRTTAPFLQGLRDRGYFDLAADYLDRLRAQPDAPKELIETIDFELGGILLDEAARTNDLVRRKELLDQGRVKLDAFTREHPTHKKTPQASLQLGRLLVERGSLSMLQADETEDKAEKDAKLTEARAAFGQARTAYTTADGAFSKSYSTFPLPLADNDPRRAEFDRTLNGMLEARLQKALVDYEQGLTYPLASKDRTDLMGKALAQFEALFKSFRTARAGLAARMWQAKCYEERGELGPAIGVYNELLEHGDPRLRELQRHVGYFKIIALGKRKEYALAADEAVRWLQANNTPDQLRSKPGLGVQLELAKDIVAQLPDVKNDAERTSAVKRVTDVLGNVVRYASPFKAEALELLKKYKPNAAASALEVSRLTYEDAVSQGEQALDAHEWDRSADLLRQAIRRAEAAHDIEKTNYARYNLAFANYMNKRYYEAAVLAEHVARRYSRAALAARAAEIGMAALAEAYNTYVEIDRTSDLNRLVDLAQYAAATFPETDQGDTARLTLGQIYHGTGRYPQAIEAYESVRPKSSKRVEALTHAGASHWQYSQALRTGVKTKEADAEVARALAVLNEALAARHGAGVAPTDAGLIGNACDIADIQLETGKAAEAVKLLDPIARAQSAGATGPSYSRLMATLLRAHVAVSQVDLAMSDMAALERAGGGGGMTQLYYNLGKLLQKEMDTLEKKGDRAGLERTRQAYFKFLTALVASKSGQTLESLEWAGENLLKLGNAHEAEGVFRQILDTYGKDEKFLARPGAADKLMVVRLKLAAALRGQQKFDDDRDILAALEKEFPRSIEVIMARGYSMEAMAESGKLASDPLFAKLAKESPTTVTQWAVASTQWRNTALRLGAARIKPVEYFEAWYHAALALHKDGKNREARQTLSSVMRLSRAVGGPEMKARYETLLKQLP